MGNCSIQADNHYLLESLAACDNKASKLTMYFTVNTAFTNYLDMFPNLTESLQFPIIKNKTMYKQTLPINLNISGLDITLLHAPTYLKDFIHTYVKQKEILICKKRHVSTILNNTNKNFFSDNYIMVIFVLTLIASLVLHQVKEKGIIPGSSGETNCECATLPYIGKNSNNTKFNNSNILCRFLILFN